MKLADAQYTADAADHRFARTHVLVIDDDPPTRRITKYLRQHDLCITAAREGPAIQSALAAGGVELALLYRNGSTEDWIALATCLRQLSAVPVIILSDRTAEADRVMSLEMGAAYYLAKPFSARELLACIRAVLRRAMTTRLDRRQLHAPHQERPVKRSRLPL